MDTLINRADMVSRNLARVGRREGRSRLAQPPSEGRPAGRRDVTSSTSCHVTRRPEKLPGVTVKAKEVYRYGFLALLKSRNSPSFKSIIPTADNTNAYYNSLECTERALDDCDANSPAKEYVTNVMERIFGQVLSLVCGPFTRGSADCHALPKLPPTPGPKKTNLIELAIEISDSFRSKKKKN
ncbi:hypothetical protein HPB51_027148 [Rhipicephalus microplus]|uniref:Uncharacterized protein n=1 Tax=Rhipicephalus microplus TaxID=6941 RepID=A0A9J6D0P6_RHIMP|nr:hypothetical protein HPB51_027148 [Rhipicephalus microplus]